MKLMIPRRDLYLFNLSVFVTGGLAFIPPESVDSWVPGRQINKDLTRDKSTPDFDFFGAIYTPDFTLELQTRHQPNTQPKKTQLITGDCRP